MNNSKMLIGVVAVVVAIGAGLLLWNMNDEKETTTQQPAQNSQQTKTEEKAGTIVDIAAGNSDFSTLVDLVKTAGLAETLSGTGPFTVFAPNNAAFAKLPAETVAALKADPSKLAEVLKYHVVSGSVKAADVVKVSSVNSVQGAAIKVFSKSGGVVLNDTSNVISTDIVADNGVIHVIDTVILPPAN